MKKQEFLTLARSMTQPGFYHTSYIETETSKLIVECRLVEEVGESKNTLLFKLVDRDYESLIVKDRFLKKFKPYSRWLQQVRLERLVK